MDTVWIVLRNGKVDEAFDNEIAARAHQKALNKIWALSDVIPKAIKSL